MENWRKRWEQLTEDVAIEGYLPNGEMASDSDIEDFISEELEKAREEGRDEIINRIDKTKIPKRFWNKEVYLGLIKWWEKEKIKLSKLKGEK